MRLFPFSAEEEDVFVWAEMTVMRKEGSKDLPVFRVDKKECAGITEEDFAKLDELIKG